MKITFDLPRKVVDWMEDRPGGAEVWLTALVERLAGFHHEARAGDPPPNTREAPFCTPREGAMGWPG